MYDTIILANSIFHNQFFLGITAHKWSNTIQAIHFCFYISTIAGCTLRRKGRIAKMARWGAWMGFGIALGQGFQCFWPCNAMRFRGKSEIRPSNISGWLSLTRTLSKFLGNLVWDGPGERDATNELVYHEMLRWLRCHSGWLTVHWNLPSLDIPPRTLHNGTYTYHILFVMWFSTQHMGWYPIHTCLLRWNGRFF